jgi:hypothetical protein
MRNRRRAAFRLAYEALRSVAYWRWPRFHAARFAPVLHSSTRRVAPRHSRCNSATCCNTFPVLLSCTRRVAPRRNTLQHVATVQPVATRCAVACLRAVADADRHPATLRCPYRHRTRRTPHEPRRVTACSAALRCCAPCCTVLNCVATQGTTLQHKCSVAQRGTVRAAAAARCNIVQHGATQVQRAARNVTPADRASS